MRLQPKLIFVSIILKLTSYNIYAQNCTEYNNLSHISNIESLNIALEDKEKKEYNKTVVLVTLLLPDQEEIKQITKRPNVVSNICLYKSSSKNQLIMHVQNNIILKVRNNEIIYKDKQVYLNKKDITNHPTGLVLINKKGDVLQRRYYDCFNRDCKNLNGYVEFPFYTKDGKFRL